MKYCIVAKDRETHNEWVMPETATTIVEIGAIMDKYRENDPRFEYRLDVADAPTKTADDRKNLIILINPGKPDEVLVRFTNVPLEIVNEAIAHINDNS